MTATTGARSPMRRALKKEPINSNFPGFEVITDSDNLAEKTEVKIFENGFTKRLTSYSEKYY
jgi:hypothetical protein